MLWPPPTSLRLRCGRLGGSSRTTFCLSLLVTDKTRIAGATPNPTGAFKLQVGRNLSDEFAGFAGNHSYLIMERHTKFAELFRDVLERDDIAPVRCPSRAPTCNAYAERFVRSIVQYRKNAFIE